MAENGRAKVGRIICIFVLSGILIIISFIRFFHIHDGYNNNIIGSAMVVIIFILLCCVLESCWMPFNSSSSSSSSNCDAPDGENANGASSMSMESPLVYSEEPPAYEEVVRSPPRETNPPGDPSARDEEMVSSAVASEDAAGGPHSSKANGRPSSGVKPFADLGNAVVSPQSNEDEFAEVYVPRRYSPFFSSDENPVRRSASVSREVQLSVDCLPTYEQAVAVHQSEDGRARGSMTSQDGDFSLFI